MNKNAVKFSNVKDILGRTSEEVDADIKKGIGIYSTVQLAKLESKSKQSVYDKYVHDSYMSLYTYINE
jgi:hypothetical protein